MSAPLRYVAGAGTAETPKSGSGRSPPERCAQAQSPGSRPIPLYTMGSCFDCVGDLMLVHTEEQAVSTKGSNNKPPLIYSGRGAKSRGFANAAESTQDVFSEIDDFATASIMFAPDFLGIGLN